MILAVAHGQLEATIELLKIPAIKVNQRTFEGMTPLHVAAMHGATAIIHALFTQPSLRPNQRDFQGRTPLHCAVLHGDIAAIKELLLSPKVDKSFKIALVIRHANWPSNKKGTIL